QNHVVPTLMPVRPAGLLESWHITRHFLGLDSCVVRLFTQGDLFPALRKVIETHPALSVMIQDEDSKPFFLRLNEIELSLVVQFSDHDDLEAAIKQQLSTRVAFHQSLLAALQDVIVGDDSPLVSVSQSLSLLPPIEAVTNVWPSLPQTAEFIPHLKLITFTSDEMSTFAKICRSHSATVTSAFYVLAVATLSRLVPPRSPPYKTLSAHVAVSLRAAARAPAAAMCDYVGVHHTYPPIHPPSSGPPPRATLPHYSARSTPRATRRDVRALEFGARRGACEWGPVAHGPHGVRAGGSGDGPGAEGECDWGPDGRGIDRRALVESFAAQFQEGVRALLV
ncbi:hypothetical protein B0H13DRAFT_1957613, partial [Mycena leptocephala]